MRDHPQALAELGALLARREPLYRQSDLEVDTTGRGIPEIVEEIARGLESLEVLELVDRPRGR